MLDAIDVRLVAALLIGGFCVFLTGAVRWQLGYQGDLAECLDLIAANPARWSWIHTWMVAGIIVTLVGLAGLSQLFLSFDGPAYSTFAFVLFVIGALPWLIGVFWRLSVLKQAALAFQTTRDIPTELTAWAGFFGNVHTLHMTLAYASWIALAAALLETSILSASIGWLGVSLGVFGLVGYALLRGGPFAPPILAHLYTLIVGIALLVEWG